MLEAECTRCHEVFVPHGASVEDIIHGETEAGQECGGIGVIQGEWTADGETPEMIDHITLEVQAAEEHGRQNPDCADPWCIHHHPDIPLCMATGWNPETPGREAAARGAVSWE